MTKPDENKVLAHNRRATHDYFIEERYEAGLVLLGTEIKAMRQGRAQLREAYVRVEGRQAVLLNAHIGIYEPAALQNHDPLRPRRLLLHKKELLKLEEKVRQKGYTVIPLKIYLVRGRAKVEIGLARGKRQYDKRQDIAERESRRDVERALRERR